MTHRTSIGRLADCAPAYGECPDCGAPEEATRVLGFACEHYHCPMAAPVASPESWPARRRPFVHFAVQDAEPTPSVSTRAGRTGSAHLPTASTVAEPARRKNPVATGKARGPQTDDREAAGGLDPTTYIDDTPVMLRVHAAIEAEAIATARAVVKYRARMYALQPRQLDTITDDLSSLPPRILVASLSVIKMYPHRLDGAEVSSTNLRGAMLYARYLRAKERQIARRAAE